ncbi:MAG: tetratricopeptide repeat protein [Treponema sp.]|nr:tetratricopeptide repeat protein [Treponema sp.]
MADIVDNAKSKKQNNPTEKVENFMVRNRKPILIVGICVIVAALAVCLYLGISDSIRKKALAEIEDIEYNYTKNFSEITDDEIATRQDTALEALKPYLEKTNFAGVRANMICADIYFSKKDYTNALNYYLKAAQAGEKLYTAPINWYNAAVCSEELGNNSDAVAYYQSAADFRDFTLASHALFNAARIKEAEGNSDEAVVLYQKLVDDYSSDSWTNLGKSRLVQLRIEGKAE